MPHEHTPHHNGLTTNPHSALLITGVHGFIEVSFKLEPYIWEHDTLYHTIVLPGAPWCVFYSYIPWKLKNPKLTCYTFSNEYEVKFNMCTCKKYGVSKGHFSVDSAITITPLATFYCFKKLFLEV